LIALLGAVSADLSAQWPLYNTATPAAAATYGAGGGYSCLRAGYTWLPQMTVTGTAAAKTVGNPDGAVWYRTADFTTSQSVSTAAVDADQQVCCPALDTSTLGGDYAT